MTIKSKLTKKERITVTNLVTNILDIYKDFYITKNNLRLFIKDNLDILFQDLKKGDKVTFNDKGLIVVCGFSDKANRKYIKILTENLETANELLKEIITKFNDIQLYVKLKKNNPVLKVFYDNKFYFNGDRGREILLVRNSEKINA